MHGNSKVYGILLCRYISKYLIISFRRYCVLILWRSGDRASWKILIIKPTRCINLSNLFLEWNSTCFGQFLCPSAGVFHCTHKQWYMSYRFADSRIRMEHPDPAVSKPVWHIPLLCVQWKTPDDGKRNCPKHVEIHSKNRSEKLVHLVGFIINLSYTGLGKTRKSSNYHFVHYRVSGQLHDPVIPIDQSCNKNKSVCCLGIKRAWRCMKQTRKIRDMPIRSDWSRTEPLEL